jgi:hypothetical protein
MSRYMMIRRLRGPAFLLMAGVIALLHQLGVIDHFWHFFWPLLLILLGVFMLAERAALASEGGYPPVPYPGAPYPGADGGTQNPAQPDVSTVPADSEYRGKDSEGGQS